MRAHEDPTREPEVLDASTFSFTDILDRHILEELRSLQEEGEPDIVTELIDLYLQEAPDRLAAIRDAVHQGDAQGLLRAAHSLKGSSANLGAAAVTALCGELERCGREDTLDGTEDLLAKLETDFTKLRGALESERVPS